MRVLQILPELNIGGVEKGTVELAKYLALHGHYPIVISSGGRLVRELQEQGIKHYTLPVHSKSPLSLCLIPQLVKILQKEQIDIVHARSRVPAIISYFAFKRYFQNLNLIKISTFVPSFVTTAHGYYRRHIFSKIMAKGKVVICPSQVIAKHMHSDFDVPIERIRIISRGVNLKEYQYISPVQRDWKHPVIAIIGRISPTKGQDIFLKAFREVLKIKPFARAWIIGTPSPGKEDYLSELELIVKRYGLENAVEFLGFRYDIADLLAKINILVQPSRIQESFGRSIIEAQARGTFAVATDLGGFRELIQDGQTGFLFPQEDEKALGRILTMILKNPSGYEKIALQARQEVEKKYDQDKIHARIVEVYKQAGESLSILFIKLTALGDAVLSIPSLRAIRNKFPKARIYLLTSDKVAGVFKNCPYVDEILIYPMRFKYLYIGKFLRKIRQIGPEISFDLQNNKISRILTFFSGTYQRYGFVKGKLDFLINKKVNLPKFPLPPVDQQLLLLSHLGIRNVDKDLELWVEEEDLRRAEEFLNAHWLSRRQKLVGINISSSQKWKSKRWPYERIIQLIDRLAKFGLRAIILGVGEDLSVSVKIVKNCSAKPINAVGKTDLGLLLGLISKCDVFLTTDSAPLHIAAGLKIPVVALFGPTDPRRHLPPGENVYFIWKKKNCSPCYKYQCNKKKSCMQDIAVEEVVDKILEVLELH
jgi:lipopolysaccharide heptosyltransferase II